MTDCGTPQPLAFPGADAAVQMGCTRAASGSPHLALAAEVGGRSWFAEGIPVTLPVMERSIGVLTGRASPGAAQPAGPAPAAVRSLGANDMDLYQALMHDGADANRTGNWEQAASLFRRAVEVQEKAQGPNSPALVNALTGLAVQFSNQGKFAEAHATFARAESLISGANAPLLRARLAHYRGLDALNQGHPDQALELLHTAELRYAATLPKDVLEPPPPPPLASRFVPTPSTMLLTSVAATRPALDATTLEALLGIIETRRNEAIALRMAGADNAAAIAAVDSAEAFARAQGLTTVKVSAFVYRTQGVTVLEGSTPGEAVSEFNSSVSAFNRALPRTLPLAETHFRRAEALLKDNKPDAALAACRAASEILRALKEGVEGTLLQPCLAAYAAQVHGAADPQPLLAEMFELAQLTRGAITAEQIQRAAVRLAAAPSVGTWVRAHDDADARLNELLRRKIELSDPAAKPSAEALAALDTQIAQARTALDQAEVELEDKLPNYNALVQQVVPAATLFAVLRPGEAFAATSLGETEGWTFLLRDNTIRIGHVAGGAPRVTGLVRRLRAGIELTDANAVPAFDSAAAQELYAAVLGEVAAGLDGATAFTVAPTGALLSMPFEVLLTGPASGTTLASAPFLVKRFPIVHVPSAANLVSLRRAAASAHAARPWFGFGDFQPIDRAQAAKLYPGPGCAESARQLASLPPLPGARAELEAVRRQLGASAADELLGTGFTRTAVLKQTLKDYRILHFATHALLPSEIVCQQEPAHRHLGAAGRKGCRAADRDRRAARPQARRRCGRAVGLQLRRLRRAGRRREPVRPGAHLLLRRRARADGDALGCRGPGRRLPGEQHARRPAGRGRPGRGAAQGAAADAGDRGLRTPVLLGARGGDRRGRRAGRLGYRFAAAFCGSITPQERARAGRAPQAGRWSRKLSGNTNSAASWGGAGPAWSTRAGTPTSTAPSPSRPSGCPRSRTRKPRNSSPVSARRRRRRHGCRIPTSCRCTTAAGSRTWLSSSWNSSRAAR